MRLDVKKIRTELKRIKKNDSWLANKLGISRQLLSYRLKSEKVTHVYSFASILGMDAQNLVKWGGGGRQ